MAVQGIASGLCSLLQMLPNRAAIYRVNRSILITHPVIWLLAITENHAFLEPHWRYWNIWMPREGLCERQGSAAVVCSVLVCTGNLALKKKFSQGTFLVECCELQKQNLVA